MKSVIRSILVLIFCFSVVYLFFPSQALAESEEWVRESMEARRLFGLNESKIFATNGIWIALCVFVVYLLKYKSINKLFVIDKDIRRIAILGALLSVIYILIGASGRETMDILGVLYNLRGIDIFFTIFWQSFFDDIVFLDILLVFVVIPFIWSCLSLFFFRKKTIVKIRQVLLLAIFLYWSIPLFGSVFFAVGEGPLFRSVFFAVCEGSERSIYLLIGIFSWLISTLAYYYIIGGAFGKILVREEVKGKK